MKTTGIVFFIFSALNFMAALVAAGKGAQEAAGQKMSSTILLVILGCIFFYLGKKKENKRREEILIAEQRKSETERKQKEIEDNKRKELERQKIIKEQKEKAEKAKKQQIFESNSKKYKILNFYMDCTYWHEQEEKLKKDPLALPVEIIDIEKNEEIRNKYNVNNLPKLILVDYNGKEITRWKGITESSEINDFLYKNGYANTDSAVLSADEKSVSTELDDDDCDDYPKPMFKLTDVDLRRLHSEFMDQCISIAAENGTKEQTQVKLEVLLGKREKTEAMIEVEKVIREFFNTIYNETAKAAFESSENPIVRKLAVITSISKTFQSLNEEDGESYPAKEKMTKIANKFGVSINLIEEEEKEIVRKKYYK